MRNHSSDRWIRRMLPIGGAALLGVALLAVGQPARSELRPLVRDMLENLGAVEDIGAGMALDDFRRVRDAAADLRDRAKRLRDADLRELAVDPKRDAQFDAYLTAQEEAAQAIHDAARERDGDTILLGLQRLYQNACLPCHAEFREREARLRPAVLFMTTFLNAWREINRGLAINDYALVARSAREIEAMGRVLAWDQVIASSFAIEEPEARREFRGYIASLTGNAGRLERAASTEDPSGVLSGMTGLWTEGCLACHRRFRGTAD